MPKPLLLRSPCVRHFCLGSVAILDSRFYMASTPFCVCVMEINHQPVLGCSLGLNPPVLAFSRADLSHTTAALVPCSPSSASYICFSRTVPPAAALGQHPRPSQCRALPFPTASAAAAEARRARVV